MPKAKSAYILLFRGVGGATQLPTAPLREALSAAGFENVATYINSGNAVLRSELPREEVIARVAEICEGRFGFTKAIFAPTLDEWSTLIARFDRDMTDLEHWVQSASDADLAAHASTIAHIGAHNAYHLGEIVYVRKLQGSWDPNKGVK